MTSASKQYQESDQSCAMLSEWLLSQMLTWTHIPWSSAEVKLQIPKCVDSSLVARAGGSGGLLKRLYYRYPTAYSLNVDVWMTQGSCCQVDERKHSDSRRLSQQARPLHLKCFRLTMVCGRSWTWPALLTPFVTPAAL